ncbi:unnamed protein product [Peniophora sp. CBMAI 1063]|nr:unnamed protein product [Peniophora sp. CBMAI 1063]
MSENQAQTPGDAWLSFTRSRFNADSPNGVAHRDLSDKLDSEFTAMERAMVEARRLRNRTRPACYAPPEVLSLLFEEVKAIWDPYVPDLGEPLRYESGWITLTHVCSLWRKVALDTPALWARHSNCFDLSPQYIPDILFRSRMVPLDIELDWERAGGNEIDKILPIWLSSPVVQRIRRLTLTHFEREEFDTACSLLPSTLTNLRELHVWSSLSGGDSGRQLPAALYELPNVTHLTLVDCYIPWEAPIFSHNLTHLHLLSTPASTAPFYRVARDLFSRMTSLQTLELNTEVPSPDLTTPSSIRQREINFPESLRELDLYIKSPGMEDGTTFLLASRIPAACRQNIVLYSGRRRNSAWNGPSGIAPHLLEQHFLALSAETSKSLLLDTTATTSGPIEASIHKYNKQHAPALDRLCIMHSDVRRRLVMSNINFCEHLPHFPLDRLHVIALAPPAVQHFHNTRSWSQLLPASNVCDVSIPDALCSEALQSLAEPHSSTDDKPPSLVFPRMGVLRLYLRGDREMEYMAVVIALVTLINKRMESGTPLRELVVPKQSSDWAVWGTVRPNVTVRFEL